MAIERNIPLIIWGQLQPIEQCGKFSHYDRVSMTKWSQLEHDRLGLDIDEMIGNGAQLNPQYLPYYDYPKKAMRLGINAPIGLYLSNFLRWDPLKQNFSILKYGFKLSMRLQLLTPTKGPAHLYITQHMKFHVC